MVGRERIKKSRSYCEVLDGLREEIAATKSGGVIVISDLTGNDTKNRLIVYLGKMLIDEGAPMYFNEDYTKLKVWD